MAARSFEVYYRIRWESGNGKVNGYLLRCVAQIICPKIDSFSECGESFAPKRKGDEATTEPEPKSADNGNERKATHRDDENETTPALVDVSSEVEIKTNKIADSWMMGVKNLKLTLYNHSNMTIQSAKVEVLYYSEQNNLLEKKVLSYTNIPPKKSQTVAAPDQRLAEQRGLWERRMDRFERYANSMDDEQ